jgi:hypothetical protein
MTMTKAKAKVKEEEQKQDDKKVLKVTAVFDQIIGKCKHFTIGKVGDVISGGIYIMVPTGVPDEISIVFKKEDKE